jgi:hypothetical protein
MTFIIIYFLILYFTYLHHRVLSECCLLSELFSELHVHTGLDWSEPPSLGLCYYRFSELERNLEHFCIETSSFWDVDSCLCSPEIRLLWDPEVRYGFHNKATF